jgi:DNA-binding protein H-NS
MKRSDFESMSTDELWMLHEKIAAKLVAKICAEQKAIENRLSLLASFRVEQKARKSERRPYPIVLPKFINPAEPSQTWAGRGKQPRWLSAQLRSGKRIDDFRIKSRTAKRLSV